jgi:hypothetical protein
VDITGLEMRFCSTGKEAISLTVLTKAVRAAQVMGSSLSLPRRIYDAEGESLRVQQTGFTRFQIAQRTEDEVQNL